MIFELVPYKKTLDQRFVNENLMPFTDGEQVDIFHASVWVDALLKNPYSEDVHDELFDFNPKYTETKDFPQV